MRTKGRRGKGKVWVSHAVKKKEEGKEKKERGREVRIREEKRKEE
jgi:hypothetical protein